MADRKVPRRDKRSPVRLQVTAGTRTAGTTRRGRSDMKPGEIDYGSIDPRTGQRSGIRAMITKEMIGTGTHADQDIRPPGFTKGEGHARGHLLGKQLGGSGDDERNLVTLFHIPANTPAMRDFETAVRAAVEKGEVVDYRVTPIYRGDEGMPIGVTMEARGDGNPPFSLAVSILNRPKGD
jgi:hypothetical protein